MTLSEKIKLLGHTQVQRLLVNMDEADLATLIAYHLDSDARNIIAANMSTRAWESARAQAEQVRSVADNFSARLNTEISRNTDSETKGTILFTDLVNSTVRQNLLGDAEYYDQVITVHNDVMEHSIRQYTGRVIKTVGDAYLATFTESWRALLACDTMLSAFASMNQQRVPDYQIIVRCALHSGLFSYRPLSNGGVDIFGADVNYAARLIGVAGGGEIWMSRSAAQDLDQNAARLR